MRPVAVIAVLALLLSTVDVVAAGPVRSASAAPAPADTAAAPSELPDRVSAGLAARRAGRRVRVDGEGSASTQTFANPDGSFTLEASPEPVFRRDGAGRDGSRWVPLSTELSGAGTAASPYVAGGLARPVTLGMDASRLLSVEVPGGHVTLSAAGLRPGAPAHNGSTVTFADAATATDLQLVVSPAGVKTNLVLKSAAAAHSFRFHLADPAGLLGLATEQADGSWLFGRDLGDGYRLALAPATAYVPAEVAAAGLDSPGVNRDSAAQQVVRAGDGWDVTLAVDPRWLAGKAFPVVLDPSPVFVSAATGNPDCHIVSGAQANTSFCSSPSRDIGFSGGLIRRSIFAYNVTTIPQTAVVSAANLDLALTTVTGGALPVNAYRMTSGWSSAATWNSNGAVAWTAGGNFDAATVVGSATIGPALGHYQLAISTALVQSWVDRTVSSFGLLLREANEATAGVLRFGSGTATDASTRARLTVTYNTPPAQAAGRSVRPCTAQCASPVLVSSLRPDLTDAASDPDGEPLRYDFEVWAGHSASPTVLAVSDQLPDVPAGTLATWTVPAGALSEGDYEYRVRAFDGALFGAWSLGYTTFTVDGPPPATPALTSSAFTEGGWGTATAGSISYSSSDTHAIAGYSWQLDGGAWSTYATATSAALSGLTDGLHRFSVQAQDRAGNVSAIATRTFGVGVGGVVSPAEGDTTQARVTLGGVAPAGRDWLSWRYRVGTTGAFAVVPAANVTMPGTSTHPTFPVGRDSASTATPKAFPAFTWDVTGTVAAPTEGLVQLQACYGTSSSDPSPACVGTPRAFQLSRAGFASAHATASIGPGTVSQLTGDFQLSESDVDVPTYQGSLSVGRTLTTLAPSAVTTGATGIFGPGWVASLPGPDAGAASLTLADTSAQGYVTLTAEDGSADVYVQQGTTSTFAGMGEAGSDGSKLVKDSATQFTLTDIDGTLTVWVRDAGGHWGPSSVVEPGSASTTSYTRDSAGRVT